MQFMWRILSLFISLRHASAQVAAPAAVPWMKPKGLLTVKSMKVASTQALGSKIYFGQNSELSVGTDTAGNFEVNQASGNTPVLQLDSQNTLHLSAQRVEASIVDVAGGISVNGVRQWQLVQSEDFSQQSLGWSRQEVSQCAGITMLGGFCKFSRGEVNKTFTGLPPHKQLRIVATYHFIDRWIGETGYMKVNVGQDSCPVVMWSEQHTQQMSKNGLNLCGQSETPEGKFTASIDVTVPHVQDSVQIAFGSTMDDADPCDESWGISGLELHVRS